MKLEIRCGGPAFQPKPEAEVARILRDLARLLESDAEARTGKLFDRDGNLAGFWDIGFPRPIAANQTAESAP